MNIWRGGSSDNYLDDGLLPVHGLGLGQVVSKTLHIITSQHLLVHPVEKLSLAVKSKSVLLRVHPERIFHMDEFIVHVDTNILTEVSNTLLKVVLEPELGVVGDWDVDVLIVLLGVVEPFLVSLGNHLAVDEHLGEHLVEGWQNKVAGVSAVEHGHAERVHEHGLVDAVAGPARCLVHGLEVLGEVEYLEHLDHLHTVRLVVHREDISTGEESLLVLNNELLDGFFIL